MWRLGGSRRAVDARRPRIAAALDGEKHAQVGATPREWRGIVRPATTGGERAVRRLLALLYERPVPVEEARPREALNAGKLATR
jgi:hypothetical protein